MSKTNKNEKKKGNIGQIIFVVIMMFMGGICGVFIGHYAKGLNIADTSGKKIAVLGLLILSLYVVLFVHLIVHEGGHLIAGLLSGYTFSSFRIGSIILVKKEGKLCVKKHSIAGTGGQCLMFPPDMIDGKIPYVLYNLGGCIANLIVTVICLGLYILCKDVPIVSVILLEFIVLGIAIALMNGIPFQAGMVNNDGYNAISLGKNVEAIRSFWIQMKANEQIGKGVRLRDMPSEWFIMPKEENLKNSMAAVLWVFACNRLIDEHKFEEAKTLMTKLLQMETAIVPIHENLLVCDCIYCELIGENDRNKIEKLYTKDLQKFLKSMKNFPSVVRTQYVYALLYEKDIEKVQKMRQKFEKVAKTYPYASDIESERELMEIADRKG